MLQEVLFESVKIISIVTVLMIFIEWLQITFNKKLKKHLTKNKFNQIVGSSLLGAVPGCFDAFFIVSLYSHGLVGFGALVAVMLATAGDEAFVMLAMAPKASIAIFSIMIVLGIVGGFIADFIAKKMNFKPAIPCYIEVHKKEKNIKHFFTEHVNNHILKKHVPRLFFWIFSTLLVIHLVLENFDVNSLIPQNGLLLIIIAALVGIIPESGPHLVFLTLYTQGLVPFSVILVSSLSQDGHGLIPLISYSIKDTVRVQIFTTLFALGVGIILFLLGF